MSAVPPPVPMLGAKMQRSFKRAAALWSVLGAVAGSAAGFFVTSASFAAKIESLSTDAEVDGKIAEHNKLPRAHGSNYEQSPHPPYAESAKKTDDNAMALEKILENQEAQFKMLGSMQVADCERNAKKRAARANKFRADFEDRVDVRKVSALKAAEDLVHEACPWMSR